ncbi:MAG TPA: hypothetical protein VHB18_02310 [Mycobacteriales bacterium]|nr:hypothetical protein [Mycobacteriales bacterium]
MAATLRTRPLYVLGGVLSIWTIGQFVLCWDAFRDIQLAVHAQASRIEFNNPHVYVLVRDLPSNLWVRAGLESVAAVVLPTVVAVFLIAGGRRWLAATVAAYPLANVLGGFHDGTPLGLGWDQTRATRDWFAYGVAIDSLLLVLIVALLIRAMPERKTVEPMRWRFARVVPVVIVLAGWWVMRHPAPTAHDWVWLGDAVTFLLVAALLADTTLPVAAKLFVVGLVLPLSTGTILDDLVAPGRIGFPAIYFLHHTLVAVATAVYVTGVPSMVDRLRTSRAFSGTV